MRSTDRLINVGSHVEHPPKDNFAVKTQHIICFFLKAIMKESETTGQINRMDATETSEDKLLVACTKKYF